MENILGTYMILEDGEQTGELRVYTQGMGAVFEANCETTREGPFRLAVYDDGNAIPLGVMMPESAHKGKRYLFKKTYSKNALLALGIKRISGCELLFTDSGESEPVPEPVSDVSSYTASQTAVSGQWEPEDEPWKLFSDNELSETCRTVRGGLRRGESDGIISFAIPIKRDEPFPAMPIFCFGQWMKIEGSNYVVFRIKDGTLV